MTILAHPALLELIEEGVIDADPACVGGSSIDIHLGAELLVEDLTTMPATVDPAKGDRPALVPVDLARPYILSPGEYVLAVTKECFRLPDDITAHLYMRSSLARAGLNHLLAFHIDPGWAADTEGGRPLTLELHNVTQNCRIVLSAGLRVAQVVFHRHEPVGFDHLYANKGRYGRTAGLEQSKGAGTNEVSPQRAAQPVSGTNEVSHERGTNEVPQTAKRPRGRPRKHPAPGVAS